MLIGQNPGKEEVKQGRPFVGKAGKFLDEILRQKGIDRKGLFITNVVKEPTPDNRKPTAREIEYWIPYLEQEITRVSPRVIVLMGTVAWKTPRIEGIKYLETYHPAAAMRFSKARKRFEEDFENLRTLVSTGT